MGNKYESLIEAWAEKSISNNGVLFSYADRDVDADSLAMLFYKTVTKRALRKLVVCISNNDLVQGKYVGIDELRADVEPIYNDILDEGYIYSPMSELDLQVVDSMPKEMFSGWVIYVLEHEILPMASRLDELLEGDKKVAG